MINELKQCAQVKLYTNLQCGKEFYVKKELQCQHYYMQFSK